MKKYTFTKIVGALMLATCLFIGFAQSQQIIYKSNSTIKKYYPNTTSTRNGVYINNFDEVLGNSGEQTALTSYLQ